MTDFQDFLAGVGLSILFVVTLSISYMIGFSNEERAVVRSCELTGAFVVQGKAYNCEVKND
jgi:hypothetical protein